MESFQHIATFLIAPAVSFLLAIHFTTKFHFFEILGKSITILALWRLSISVYRRLIKRAKDPLSYGKWAIVTGSTSGIGRDFAEYLAKLGMSLVLVSRTESKLIDQKTELIEKYPGISVEYLTYDFGQLGALLTGYYEKLNILCKQLHNDGGIGILLNNVGTANEYPKRLEEFTSTEALEILNCNIYSTTHMTKTVLPFMEERHNGCVVCVSSGSAHYPGAWLSIYSATKAFITQFTRSLHVEYVHSGVDFYVATPFYVVSNLFKRKSGTLIAPMPIALIKGIMKQLGKKYLYQGHGYWFHGFMGHGAHLLPITVPRFRKIMMDNRARYDERQAKKK